MARESAVIEQQNQVIHRDTYIIDHRYLVNMTFLNFWLTLNPGTPRVQEIMRGVALSAPIRALQGDYHHYLINKYESRYHEIWNLPVPENEKYLKGSAKG